VPEGEVLFELDSIGYEFFIILTGRVGIHLRLQLADYEEQKKLILESQDVPFKEDRKPRNKSDFEGVPNSPPVKYSTVMRKGDGYHVLHRTVLLKEVNKLGEGFCFGEAALIKDKSALRNATILCLEDSYFAVLDKANYERIIGEHQQKALMEKVLFFKKAPLFSFMAETIIKTILPFFELNKYPFRHCLFKQRDEVTHLYFIKSGNVRVGQD